MVCIKLPVDLNTTNAYVNLKKCVYYGQSSEIQLKFELGNLKLRLGNFIERVHLLKNAIVTHLCISSDHI